MKNELKKITNLGQKSTRIEKELLNRIIFAENLIPACLTKVNKTHFYHYGNAFEIITEAYKEKKDINFVVIENNLTDIIKTDFSFRDINVICDELVDISNAINLWKILQQGVENLPSEKIDEYVSELQRKIINEIKHSETSKADIQSVLKEFENRKNEYKLKKETGQELLGISTGYEKLDNVIDGLRPSHFWIIGGYTNSGKTSASLNIVSNLIKQGKRVVYYSLEMNSVDIFSRLLGIMTEESGLSIIKGYSKKEELIDKTIQDIINSKLSIHTGKSELSEILFSMYQENINNLVDLFVIDFIQIITIKNARSEYETITTCSTEIQQIAKKLNVPVMALSQISNEGAKSSDGVVMSFKGSGAIASSADLAIEIGIGEESIQDWKQKMNDGKSVKMKWSIRKNRHGKVGMIEMSFDGRTGIFKDYEEESKANLNKEF